MMSIEKPIQGVYLEICSSSPSSAVAAQKGGASRIELCQNLENGGITPSHGQIALTRSLLDIGIHVLIRPRGGDFVYNELELEEMRRDIAFCREIGCDGVVIGALTDEGQVDLVKMKYLMEAATGLTVVFHRAFDKCIDPEQALSDVVNLGCHRLLSSGVRNTALEGVGTLKNLIDLAGSKIQIMPGAGIDASNINTIVEITGARHIHSSAKTAMHSSMSRSNHQVAGMDEPVLRTSESKVRELVQILDSM